MIGYSKILSQSEHNFMLEIFFLSSRPALMYLLIDISTIYLSTRSRKYKANQYWELSVIGSIFINAISLLYASIFLSYKQIRPHRGHDVHEEPIVRGRGGRLHDGHSIHGFHFKLLDVFEQWKGSEKSFQMDTDNRVATPIPFVY